MGATGLIGEAQSGGYHLFYSFDTTGNIAQRWNNTTLDSAYGFDGYGKALAGAAGNYDPHTSYASQSGGYADFDTNLVLMGHRYYNPNSGRFLTRDPSGYGGGINLYGYTQNNPVNDDDPLGLDSKTDAAIEAEYTAIGGLLGSIGGGGLGGGMGAAAGGVGATPGEIVGQAAGGVVGAALGNVLGHAAVGIMHAIGGSGDGGGLDLPPSGSAPKFIKPPKPPVPGGLRGASPGLKGIFKGGTVRNKSIIEIRDILLKNGFKMQKANGRGYYFTHPSGESVRMMCRNGGWDARITKGFPGREYLDEFGNQGNGRGAIHNITILNQ